MKQKKQTPTKEHHFLYRFIYSGETIGRYKFVIATTKRNAHRAFISSIVYPLSFYDVKKTNKMPILFDGEILEPTIKMNQNELS